MKKLIVPIVKFAATCLLAHGAWAAQFQPTTGGNLDDESNWNNTTDVSYAVAKRQTAALTISTSSATLPNSGSLLYRTYVYTNDFGAGNMLTVPLLLVEQNAFLVHKAGKIKGTSTNASVNQQTRMAPGNAIFTGADSYLEVDGVLNVGTDAATGTLAAESGASVAASEIKIAAGSSLSAKDAGTTVEAVTFTMGGGEASMTDGATLTITGSMALNSGASLVVENATFAHDTTTDNKLFVNSGATLQVKDSTMRFTGIKGKLCVDGGMAVFDGATIEFGSANKQMLGGGDSGGTIIFTGDSSSLNHRFSMTGDDFTFCVSNTTVNFSPEDASELFITGSGTSNEALAKTLRFCGAAPRLEIASSNGFHLRGTKGVTLQFDIGQEGFPADAAVLEITAGGIFKGDASACAASQIVLNVDDHCPTGTYTLLKGSKATTFINGTAGNPRATDKYVLNFNRAMHRVAIVETTVGGVDAVQAVVKPAGFLLIFR